MRAFVKDKKRTQFMQMADVFSNNKVIYQDLELKYFNDNNGELGEEITDESLLLVCAQSEFKDNLICLFGKEKPLFINENVQVISNGKSWARLIDALKNIYPNVDFKHNERFMNISLVD